MERKFAKIPYIRKYNAELSDSAGVGRRPYPGLNLQAASLIIQSIGPGKNHALRRRFSRHHA
jgi:hypothetical protein